MDPRQLVDAHLRAEDVGDVEAVLDTFTEDCIYQIPAYGIDLRGKEQIGNFYAGMFASFPDFENVSETVYAGDGAIFVEIVTERTHDGIWRDIPPTGRRFQTSSLAKFPIAPDGLLGGEIVYVDPVDALYKIGALPARDLFAIAHRFRPLAGLSALVTGATGGIGAAMAAALAEAGANLTVTGRNEAALHEVAATCRESGMRVRTAVLDVTAPDAVSAALADHAREFGGLDVLVTAHGSTVRAPALEMSVEDWDRIQDLNLRSVFVACQAAGRIMVDQGRSGSIVNVASLNSVVGNRWAAGYAASKGGVAQLTKSLALEWAEHGIRVNAIGPGMIETAMTGPLREGPRWAELMQRIPMGRPGTPDDLRGATVFLASPTSSYMTGQVLYVDGGYLAV